jgi:hypothetical protein
MLRYPSRYGPATAAGGQPCSASIQPRSNSNCRIRSESGGVFCGSLASIGFTKLARGLLHRKSPDLAAFGLGGNPALIQVAHGTFKGLKPLP